MDGPQSEWFSAKELAYLENPESVDSKHRSTIRSRIEEKVNEGVIQDIERIPDLLDFLGSTTRESIRLQSEPAHVGHGLGLLYPEQLSELMFGLLLSKKRPNETTTEFVDRFNTIFEEVGTDVRQRIQKVQLSQDLSGQFQTFTKTLFEKITRHASATQKLWDVKIRIPVDEFVEWTIEQKGNTDFDYLPQIFDTAFGITVDDPPPRRFVDYWNLLTQAAKENDINPPEGGGWDIEYKNPSTRDKELHEAALSALDDELHTATHRFFEEKKVLERDQLLALGLYSYAKLDHRDKQILDRIPCSNGHDGWTRYDTRRANILTDDRSLPLLSRETIPKHGADEKRYEFTPYGRFVHWLTSYVDDKESYQAVLRDFLTDAPEDLVDEANEWVTEYTGAARRYNEDDHETHDSPDDEDTSEFGNPLSNAMLWIRVTQVTDDAEWEDD